MKYHKFISKFALLTILLISDVSAQNFYTCIPEDDWFKKNFDLNMLKEKFKIAKTQIDNESAWVLIAKNRTSGSLNMGIYRVIVAGGAGGRGGNATVNANGPGVGGCYNTHKGGAGGKGQVKKDVFLLNDAALFIATIGKKGKDGENKSCGDCEITGGKGENGKESSIKIGKIINLKANGGDCGVPAFNDDSSCGTKGNSACSCYDGKDGVNYPVGNTGYGYVKIYKYKG